MGGRDGVDVRIIKSPLTSAQIEYGMTVAFRYGLITGNPFYDAHVKLYHENRMLKVRDRLFVSPEFVAKLLEMP